MDQGSDAPHQRPANRDRRPGQESGNGGQNTFADVFNSFTLDRSWRGRGKITADGGRDAESPKSPEPWRETDRAAAGETQPGHGETSGEDTAAIIRPYVWTQGRTRSDFTLELETLVSSSAHGEHQFAQSEGEQEEHHAVVRICSQPRSVAEIAALLSVPLGIARVLVGDMAELGLLHIHDNSAVGGEHAPDSDLMERVLSGLREL